MYDEIDIKIPTAAFLRYSSAIRINDEINYISIFCQKKKKNRTQDEELRLYKEHYLI